MVLNDDERADLLSEYEQHIEMKVASGLSEEDAIADFGDPEELIKELQNHVKVNTAPYKYPRIVEFVDELPKTQSGKIRRAEIRENDSKKAKCM